MLILHGNSISPDTAEAFRFVRDIILSFVSIPITKAFLSHLKLFILATMQTLNQNVISREKRKQRETELQEKKDEEDERNTLYTLSHQSSK